MIISVDHEGLEWVTAVYLSQDKVGIQEIWDGVDQHSDNQRRFTLPSRVIAKKFVFRLIYGGSAYSYANDPEFTPVSTNVDFWQGVIDEFYKKYTGLAEWHKSLVETVGRDGKLVTPSGRVYHFKPYQRGNGEWVLPRTKILNYPVQGLGADIVMLSRISLWNRLNSAVGVGIQAKFVNTVHDDIWLDVHPSHLDALKEIIKGVFGDLPKNFERSFKKEFNLPTRYKIKLLTGEPI